MDRPILANFSQPSSVGTRHFIIYPPHRIYLAVPVKLTVSGANLQSVLPGIGANPQ